MTSDQLARSYLRKCGDRLAALEVLRAREAHSDVVRESQEVVELAAKGILRSIGIDPPKIHDVGELLLEYADRCPALSREELERLAADSRRLRREREFSFYGEADLIPTSLYTAADADQSLEAARFATALLERCIGRR
ncbi:MAG: HEPN domain-containing protein [Kiritimatiellae bacterium]|nr:HEPN domain-containing protein [Kiritimatiellia bacterium]